MGFQADAIVCGINIRIGYGNTVAIHDIKTIVVPESPAVDSNTVCPYIFTSVVCLHPRGGIAHCYSPDQNVFAGTKIYQHGPDFDFGPVVTKGILYKSFMD
jgi:hypothetical protein